MKCGEVNSAINTLRAVAVIEAPDFFWLRAISTKALAILRRYRPLREQQRNVIDQLRRLHVRLGEDGLHRLRWPLIRHRAGHLQMRKPHRWTLVWYLYKTPTGHTGAIEGEGQLVARLESDLGRKTFRAMRQGDPADRPKAGWMTPVSRD